MESHLQCKNCQQPLKPEDVVCQNCGILAPGVVEFTSTNPDEKPGKSGFYWIGLLLMISGFLCGFLSLVLGGFLFFTEIFPQPEQNRANQSVILTTPSPVKNNTTTARPVETQEIAQSTPVKSPELTKQKNNEESSQKYFDDFSDINSGWLDEVEDTHRMGYFQQGNYSIAINQPDLIALTSPPFVFDKPNGNIKIKVRAKGSGNGSYGLLCRYVDVENFYLIGFFDNSYTISKRINNKDSDLLDPPWKKIIKNNPSSDGYLNITITCSKDQIQLIINEVLHEVLEGSELPQADVAIYASSEDEKNSDGIYEQAFFDDFSMELVEP